MGVETVILEATQDSTVEATLDSTVEAIPDSTVDTIMDVTLALTDVLQEVPGQAHHLAAAVRSILESEYGSCVFQLHWYSSAKLDGQSIPILVMCYPD